MIIASGAQYNVSIATQPPGHLCLVTSNTGRVADGPVTNVAVSCL